MVEWCKEFSPINDSLIADILIVGETGFIEFEYQTTENDDIEGTWTLVATQNKVKEFIYVGYGEMPSIPVNIEYDKINYKSIYEISKKINLTPIK